MPAHEMNSAVDGDAQADEPEDVEDDSDLHLESFAPSQFDPKYEASKYEFWAYCGWLVGNSGLAWYTFGPVAFQNLLSQAAGTSDMLRFGGRLIFFPPIPRR